MSETSHQRRESDAQRVNQLLLQAALLLIVVVLAAGVYLVYYVVGHQGLPSSFQEKAIQDARVAYLDSPRDSTVVATYARALIADEQLGKAANVIDEFRSTEATSPAPLVTVEEARLEWVRGNTDDALVTLDSAMAECEELREIRISTLRAKGVSMEIGMPEVIQVALLRTDILESEGRVAEAVEVLTRALGEDPTMADVLVRRASLYATLGRSAESRDDYERALQMIPDYQPAVEGLEQLDD